MDFNLTRQTVCLNETIYRGTTEQAVDSDVTLPDYCPDILRILKCSIIPRITGSQVSGERITAEGNALVRVLYVSDGNGLRCFEQNIPFSKYVEAKQLTENPCVKVRAKAEYVNCRVVNQRRMDIHGSIMISIHATRPKQLDLISEASGAGVQLQCKKRNVSNVVGMAERSFSLGEVAEIGQTKSPIMQLLRTEAVVTTQEAKVINNKILLKGSMEVKTTYCADTDEGQPEIIEHSMPISQIVEVEGIAEDCITDICSEVVSLDVQPKPDSDGSVRLLDINARVSVSVTAYRECEIPFLIDAYSTEYELNTEQQTVEMTKLCDIMQDTCLCRGTVESESAGFSKILDIWSNDITSNSKQEGRQLKIQGTSSVSIVFTDKDGNLSYIERPIDYEYVHEMKECSEAELRVNPFVTVTGIDFVMNSDSTVEVRLELRITGSILAAVTGKLITDLSPDEDCPKSKNGAALTIYFSESGESVWNIARRYNTTTDAVMLENHLEEDTVSEKRMLLIPSV